MRKSDLSDNYRASSVMQISHQLVPKLKNLRLSGNLATLKVRTQQAIEEKLSYIEFLQRLMEDEVECCDQKQLALRLRRSSFDLEKTLEGQGPRCLQSIEHAHVAVQLHFYPSNGSFRER